MVSILAFVIEVLFFLGLPSALSHNDVLGVSNKSDAETITDRFTKIPEKFLPDENFDDADANRRYAEVSLSGDAISKESHVEVLKLFESDVKSAGEDDDGKNDKEKIADSTTADDHSNASDQKVSIISSICIGPNFP